MNNFFLIHGLTRMDEYVNLLLQKNDGSQLKRNIPDHNRDHIKERKVFYLLLSTISLVTFGALDLYTGNQISFMPFYLIPITIAAVWVGRPWGIIMAVVSGFSWLLVDIHSGSTYLHGVIPYWNAAVRMFFFILTAIFIRAIHDLRIEKEKARTDYLTGLANKRKFYDLANKEIERSRRHNHPLSLVFMDCDNFKKVNDQFGHKTGDDLIIGVADVIKKNIRGTDLAARFGGDEFVILLPETGSDGVQNFVERLNNSIPHLGHNYGWPVTASMGAVTYKTPPDSIDMMIAKADVLMYAAKDKPEENGIEIFRD